MIQMASVPRLGQEVAPIVLRIVGGALAGRDLEVPEREFLFGRDASPPGNLDNDPRLSRRHALIVRGSNDTIVLQDLGSTNGTFVNGQRIAGRCVIQPGDRITVGGTELIVADLSGQLNATAVVPLRPASPGDRGRSSSTQLLTDARRLYEARRYSEAEAMFRRVASDAPPAEAAEGRYGAGLVRFNLGDLDGAALMFEQCVSQMPAHANALYQLGRIAAKRGSPATAKSFFERALSANPDHASARAFLAKDSDGVGTRRDRPTHTEAPSENAAGTEAAYRKYGPYEFLLQDRSPLSRDTIKVMDALRMTRHPHLSAFLGKLLRRLVILAGGVAFASAAQGPGSQGFQMVGWGLAALGALMLLWKILVISTTEVRIDKGRLQIEKGLLTRRLKNIELWRVEDVDFRKTMLNRLTRDGILVIHTLPRARDKNKSIEVPGLARGRRLREIHQELLNLTWLLRSNQAVKGVIY
jgi:pSer/pThr/pTyr-binding forkhead associated (FHA) protein/membrane protein YdbS with pleckstrin-like domain